MMTINLNFNQLAPKKQLFITNLLIKKTTAKIAELIKFNKVFVTIGLCFLLITNPFFSSFYLTSILFKTSIFLMSATTITTTIALKRLLNKKKQLTYQAELIHVNLYPNDFNRAPKGIINNGNNCWACSLMQFILKSKALTTGIHASNYTDLKNCIIDYSKPKNPNAQTTSNLNIQNFKKAINIAPNRSTQEDPQEACLNSPLYNFIPEIRLFPNSPSDIFKYITLPINASTKLPDMINDFLEDKSFDATPPELFFQLLRFDNSGKTITTQVTIPSEVELTNNHIKNLKSKNVKYELNAFIKHYGLHINFGHYIAFVKNNNKWFKCNDNYVQEISEKEALENAKQAYLIHYAKEEPMPFIKN